MAFFRKWKLHYKHKKLSEEWALATSMKDLSDNGNEITACNIDDDDSTPAISTFDLKYLGSTSIDSEKSKKSTAEAIKSVISTSKTSKRKNQRIKLIVSPQGIEVLNPQTGDILLRVSIYKISYCSADAAHDHVFAFVGSPDCVSSSNDTEENLACHVFYCAKRKIAHDVTLTVARSFENAYELWRETVKRKMLKDEMKNRKNDKENQNNLNNNLIIASNEKVIDDKHITDGKCGNEENTKANNEYHDLLIDFTPDIRNDLFEKDNREYLQNTWVSFEDDNNISRNCNNNNNNNNNSNAFGQLLVC